MGVIGPHEGRELKLMIEGSKHIALFYSDYDIPTDFIPYIEKNQFCLEMVELLDVNNSSFSYYIIYNPLYAHKANRLVHVLRNSFNKFDLDSEREIGELLGYKSEDIEYYIKKMFR